MTFCRENILLTVFFEFMKIKKIILFNENYCETNICSKKRVIYTELVYAYLQCKNLSIESQPTAVLLLFNCFCVDS